MRLENLARLLNGILVNRPTISQITGFSFEAKSVKRGHAFVCLIADDTDIAQAIKNGAYAIITSENLKIIDAEVAYIRVSSVQVALLRLIRYFISEKQIKFYCVNVAQMAMLSRMSIKNAGLLPNNIDELFKCIDTASIGSVFFSDNTRLLEQISPFYERVFADVNAILINPSSIFFTTTICDGVYYQNLNIPHVFLGAFCGLIKFLKANNIHFKVGEMRNLGHFEPVFVDKNFYVTSFGSSFRAVITESDDELFKIEINYLKNHFDEKDIIIALPKNGSLQIDGAFYFDDLSEIKKLKNFRYILTLCKKQELLNVLNEDVEQNLLF